MATEGVEEAVATELRLMKAKLGQPPVRYAYDFVGSFEQQVVATEDVPTGAGPVLSAPFARPGTAAKAEVIARLCASRLPFVSVVAPAGYGKTTLLARWAEVDERAFAWVALDGGDGDVVVFLRCIAAAVHGVEPLSPLVFEALSGPGGASWPQRVARLGSALAGVERPLVLVLDDLHAVANRSCLDALAALVECLPAASQIAVASRQEPELPLPRWRAQGSVHEVGVADLRLDEREAGLLLAAAGVELDASELSVLSERTEGWAAGLYLAALALQAGAPSPASAVGFAGDDRFVSDYFRAELLGRLPPLEAGFLKYTSVLERMCGGLCDSMLQTTRSADTLDTLERRNCFVVPLDRHCEWYRYHHLFGQLLRNELKRTEPDMVPDLNSRAMAWCIDNDQTEAAVVYGHTAGETDTVASLLDTLAMPLYYDGRMETVDEWLGWFSDEELTRYPALAVYGAWFRVLSGRPAEAERWLALADGATSTIPLSDGSATIEPWVAALRACMMPDGLEQALVDADRALDHFPADSDWRPAALATRGSIHVLLGHIDLATDDLTTAIEAGLISGAAEPVYVAYAQLALLAAKQGAWAEGNRRAQSAQAVVEEAGLSDYGSSAIAHVVTARIAVHGARPQDARAAITRAHRLRPLLDHGVPWLTIQVGLELTRAHLALADAAAARTILSETKRVLELRPHMGTLVEDTQELDDRVAASTGSAGAWAMSLTAAELRLLPYLATHLTFPEIGSRLFISRTTVKTEAVSLYRKLSASSRSQAIERAIEVGLIEGSLYPPRPDPVPHGHDAPAAAGRM